MDEEAIKTLCQKYGFPLIDLQTSGDVLILTPDSLQGLPEAERLQALADDLGDGEWEYVTFNIPEEMS